MLTAPCLLPPLLRRRRKDETAVTNVWGLGQGLWGPCPWVAFGLGGGLPGEDHPRDRCRARVLREAAPPCSPAGPPAASAHVTARRALMRFPRPAARPRGWLGLRLRRLRDAGRARDAPAGAGGPGLRDGTVSDGPWLGRGVPGGPEVRVPGSCAPRGSGRAGLMGLTGTRGEGWPVAAPRPGSVRVPRLARPPAGAGTSPASCDRGPRLPQTRFSVAFGDVGTPGLAQPR